MDLVPLAAVAAGPDLLDACREHWARGGAVLPFDPRDPRGAPRGAGTEEVPAGVVAVLFTSGTSGPPKGVMLTHDALRAAARLSNRALGAGPSSRWLACVPLHHVAGFGILMRAADLGVPPIVHDRFEVESVRRAEADLISLVPTMLVRLLDAGVDLTRFTILLGGGPIPAELLRRAETAGIKVVRSYGMTETCGGVVYDGKALPGVRIEIVDGQRIAIASPTLMAGYLASETGLGLDGDRFVTADRGRLVDDRLEVLGRLDRVIVTGGEKVSAEELESLLLQHPGVTDAFVFGLPDDEWGERVVAVCAAQGKADIEDIRTFVAERAAPHEIPKQVVLLDEIPRLASGTVDRESAERLAGF